MVCTICSISTITKISKIIEGLYIINVIKFINDDVPEKSRVAVDGIQSQRDSNPRRTGSTVDMPAILSGLWQMPK